MKQIPNELAIEIDIPLDWKDTLAVDDLVPFFFFVDLEVFAFAFVAFVIFVAKA